MRNTTLDEMVEQLRAECRLSTDSSRGMESRPHLIQVLNRVYETMWNDYDWDFLKVTREDSQKNINAGQRYYDAPTIMDVDQINEAWVRWGGNWRKLDYGIGYEQYNQHDSSLDVRQDPACRWEVRDNRQIELWPIPASGGSIMAFEGQRRFARLAAGEDRCLLDDTLIVLFSAADILQGNKQEDAKAKSTMAQARLAKLRASATGKSRTTVGRGQRQESTSGIRVAYVR
jgi:hypothetical protein